MDPWVLLHLLLHDSGHLPLAATEKNVSAHAPQIITVNMNMTMSMAFPLMIAFVTGLFASAVLKGQFVN